MAQSRARPTDYTGRQRAKLEAEHAEVIRAREDQIAMVQASAQAEIDDTIHDVVGERQVQELNEAGEVVYVEAPARTIRVNANIEQMTFGAGNIYDFKEGGQYRVPAHVADHLEELGYVWH